MMLEWFALTPAVLAGMLIVFVPGLLAFSAVGLRGLALLAAAPMFGIVATAAAAVVFGMVGIAWSPVSWGIAMIILAAIAWGIGRLLGHDLPRFRSPSPRWILITAVGIGVVLAAWRLISYISDPEGISQTNDAVFHMNAVRFILENGDASSLHVNAVIGGRTFYPAAWHGVVSLMVLLTGTSISAAANAFTLIIGALIWPLGITWLTRALTGSSAVAGTAAVLSSGLHTFPLLMFQWGVLFPNALSTALVPAGVALVVCLPRWNEASTGIRVAVRSTLMLAVAAGSLLLSQPAAFLPWAAICLVWLAFWLSRESGLHVWATSLILVVGGAALVGIWLYLAQATSGSHWPPFRSRLEALVDILLNGHVLIPVHLGISALMLVGLVVAVVRVQYRWFVVAWLGLSGLYFLVATVTHEFVRNDLLGAWYADPYRIAALAPITAIPLAAIGVDAIVRAVARRTNRTTDGAGTALASIGAMTVLMVVLVVLRPVSMPAFVEGTYDAESRYVASADSFLTPDERDMLESLDELVPPDSRVLGNPSTGSGFGYFLSGIDVFPRTWAPPATDTWTVLATSLRYAADDSAVCEALAAYGDPEYVLDFGLGEQVPGRYEMPGMTDFADQDGFELIAEEGDTSLWRITACAQ